MSTVIIPLGTSAAVPAHGRHLSAVALWHQQSGQTLLFDCGEGTQFQLLRSDVRVSRLEAIFISHLHGDHIYGLPGLLSSLSMAQFTRKLSVIGPVGLADFLACVPGKGFDLPLEVKEISEAFSEGVVYQNKHYQVRARPIDHRIFALGYRFQEEDRPGKLDVEKANRLGIHDYHDYQALKAGKRVQNVAGSWVEPVDVVGPKRQGVSFAYVSDSRPCKNGVELARNVDLLYHEATFTRDRQGIAHDRGHATAEEAAKVAREAGAARLLITHFSARYEQTNGLVAEAQALFPNTEAAEELKRYPLPVH